MARVGVEIFTAGDGINYPQKGKHVVTIHYVGYVCDACHSCQLPTLASFDLFPCAAPKGRIKV